MSYCYHKLTVPSVKLLIGSHHSFSVSGLTVWNASPDYLRNPSLSTELFKLLSKTLVRSILTWSLVSLYYIIDWLMVYVYNIRTDTYSLQCYSELVTCSPRTFNRRSSGCTVLCRLMRFVCQCVITLSLHSFTADCCVTVVKPSILTTELPHQMTRTWASRPRPRPIWPTTYLLPLRPGPRTNITIKFHSTRLCSSIQNYSSERFCKAINAIKYTKPCF